MSHGIDFTLEVAHPYPCTLQHRLQVFRNVERRLGLALDLVHSHAIRNLDQREAMSKVNIKDSLKYG